MPPFVDLVQRFDSYLREERGLSSHTIHNRYWHVQAFLRWLSEQGSSIGEMRLEELGLCGRTGPDFRQLGGAIPHQCLAGQH